MRTEFSVVKVTMWIKASELRERVLSVSYKFESVRTIKVQRCQNILLPENRANIYK